MTGSMIITSFVGVGIIRFGESRSVVRRLLGAPVVTFRKDVGENETDAFNSLGLHVYYDGRDGVEYVEMFDPAMPVLNGVTFLGRVMSVVDSDLRRMGAKGRAVDVGMIYDDLGLAFTAPTGIVEGVGAFRIGYYG